jgi:hypothetical protein
VQPSGNNRFCYSRLCGNSSGARRGTQGSVKLLSGESADADGRRRERTSTYNAVRYGALPAPASGLAAFMLFINTSPSRPDALKTAQPQLETVGQRRHLITLSVRSQSPPRWTIVSPIV